MDRLPYLDDLRDTYGEFRKVKKTGEMLKVFSIRERESRLVSKLTYTNEALI